jgi:hypothetical protein
MYKVVYSTLTLFNVGNVLLCVIYQLSITVFMYATRRSRGPGSSVGIATDYGLDGPRIEFRWGRDFSQTSRPALSPTQPPVQWIQGLSRG